MEVADVIRLAGKTTVAQITRREDFAARLREGHAVGLHELLYPLLQGYDSVAIRSDVELGGTDQLFNLLFAREVQAQHGLEPQDILTTPLLVGVDGVQKMSKSLDNYVGVTDAPNDMFGKLMSLPDEHIVTYLRLVSGVAEAEVAGIEQALTAGENPRDAKARLARAVVERFHGAEAAQQAEEAFTAQFRRGELPERIDEVALPSISGAATVASTMVALSLAVSKSEARRLVSQGGVRVNGSRVEDPEMIYVAADGDLWQVGKRRFLRLRVS
jgi:tyrosyl-tRNA synthetase